MRYQSVRVYCISIKHDHILVEYKDRQVQDDLNCKEVGICLAKVPTQQGANTLCVSKKHVDVTSYPPSITTLVIYIL